MRNFRAVFSPDNLNMLGGFTVHIKALDYRSLINEINNIVHFLTPEKIFYIHVYQDDVLKEPFIKITASALLADGLVLNG